MKNKIKYIAFGLIALLIGICFVSFIPKNSVSADDYSFEAELVQDNTYLPDYAIDDVEFANVNGDMVCSITKTETSFSDFIKFTSTELPSFKPTQFIVDFDFSSSDEMRAYWGDYLSIVMTSSVGFSFYNHGNNYYSICDWNTTDEFSIYIRGSWFGYFGQNTYSATNLTDFCDFDSNTNTRFDICSLDNTFWGLLYSYSFGFGSYVGLRSLFDYVESFCAIGDGMYYFDYMTSFDLVPGRLLNYKTSLTYDYYFDFYELNVGVYRPSYRINNTLILYNFDYYYGLYSNITYLNYVLRQGNYYYNVNYGDSSLTADDTPLPNSSFVCFYSEGVQNILFDEYVTILCKSRKYIPFNIEDDMLYITAGFDFNFVYYSEPLVASNGSYNYDFDKPSYVKMEFSLNPFYIPLLELVENALIFLIFYCPIISDIMEFTHLDVFMGGILTAVNFVVKAPVGQFVLACIGFILFFVLLKSFMPVVYGIAGRGIGFVKEKYHNSNGYKYRQEKKQAKKALKYQQYKEKKFIKRANRASVKQRVKNTSRKHVKMVDKIEKLYNKKKK